LVKAKTPVIVLNDLDLADPSVINQIGYYQSHDADGNPVPVGTGLLGGDIYNDHVLGMGPQNITRAGVASLVIPANYIIDVSIENATGTLPNRNLLLQVNGTRNDVSS